MYAWGVLRIRCVLMSGVDDQLESYVMWKSRVSVSMKHFEIVFLKICNRYCALYDHYLYSANNILDV